MELLQPIFKHFPPPILLVTEIYSGRITGPSRSRNGVVGSKVRGSGRLIGNTEVMAQIAPSGDYFRRVHSSGSTGSLGLRSVGIGSLSF